MHFKSIRGPFFTIIVWLICIGLPILSIWQFLNGEMAPNEYWVFGLIAGVIGLLLWLFFGTKYELSQNTLRYQSGPFRGEIKVDSIKTVINGKTMWVGFKPATAGNGLIIKYNQFDDIYISPKTNDRFIKQLLKINPTIQIEDASKH